MSAYFHPTWDHGLAAAVALLVATILAGLGRLVIDPRGTRVDPVSLPFAMVAGWGVLTLISAITAIPGWRQDAVVLALAGIGLVGAVVPLGRGWPSRTELPMLGRVALLMLPLLLLTAALPATMYDEFAHWLPNTRHLVEHGHYPTAVLPNLWTGKPSYPDAGPLIGYLGHLLSGISFESPAKLLTVCLAGAFGVVVAAALRQDFRHPVTLGWLAGGVLVGVLLNPTFDPRFALTAYTDMPSALTLALMACALWRALHAMTDGGSPGAGAWLWRAGLCGLTLIMLRQTNAVLIGGVLLGFGIAGGVDRRLRWGTVIRGLVAAGLPTAAGAVIWRLYLLREAIPAVPRDDDGLGAAWAVRPFAEWNWSGPLVILRSLLAARLTNNPLVGTVALVGLVLALGLAIHALRRARREAVTLLMIVATAGVVFVGFLNFLYVSLFSPAELLSQTNSTWRYLSVFGPLAVLWGVVVVAPMMPALPVVLAGRRGRRLAAAVLVAAVLAAPIAAARHFRIDCAHADIMAMRRTIRELAPHIDPAQGLMIVHQEFAQWMARSVAYDLQRTFPVTPPLTAPEDAPVEAIARGALAAGATQVLDMRGIDRWTLQRDAALPPARLYRVAPPASADAAPTLTLIAATAPITLANSCRIFPFGFAGPDLPGGDPRRAFHGS